MDSLSQDEILLAPSIFLTSPQVNDSLFAKVSTESCQLIASRIPCEEYSYLNSTCCRSSISPDFESDTESYDALYSNLIQSPGDTENRFVDEQGTNAFNSTNYRDYESDDVSDEPGEKAVYGVRIGSSNREWEGISYAGTKVVQQLDTKQCSNDSLDSLLSKIAESVFSCNQKEGTQNNPIPDEFPMETLNIKYDAMDSKKEAATLISDFPPIKENELLEENDIGYLSPASFKEVSDYIRPTSPEISEKELLALFEEMQDNGQNKRQMSVSSSVINLIESNCYIKPESSYHLPTKKLAFLKNEDANICYNPYYSFLPEYTGNNKHNVSTSTTSSLLDNEPIEECAEPQRLIKSCEFPQKAFPYDPLRFLTYIKSNTVGGDFRATPDVHYNPYYTFLPPFDKGAVNEAEPRATIEASKEEIKEVTQYEDFRNESETTESHISPETAGDGLAEETKKCYENEETTQKLKEHNSKHKMDEENKKKYPCEKCSSKRLKPSKSSIAKQCLLNCPKPVVAIIPQDVIPHTSSSINKQLVAVISQLFKETMPEPIVHETPSTHSNDVDENDVQNICLHSQVQDETQTSKTQISESFDQEEQNTESIIKKDSEPSTWRNIGWPNVDKILDDSELGHPKESQESMPTTVIEDLNKVIWPSVICYSDNWTGERPISQGSGTDENRQLEPPDDFANNSRPDLDRSSDTLIMSSLYEHPHRHAEIPADVSNSVSSGTLLRYQYVGCPLCSSSSTVVDGKELERLVTLQRRGSPTAIRSEEHSEPLTRETKSDPKPSIIKCEELQSPAKKSVTIARQLLHPQVDSMRMNDNRFCRSVTGGEDRNETVDSTVEQRPGVLANVRLAAGGSIIIPPTMRPSALEGIKCERSSSAGHGDGHDMRNIMKQYNRRFHIKKTIRPLAPWSAPPDVRAEKKDPKNDNASTKPLRINDSSHTLSKGNLHPTCKGDNVCTNNTRNERKSQTIKQKMTEKLFIDNDRMLIFSWDDISKESYTDPAFGKRSYTMLHWSDSPYTATPKHVLADILKRVITSVSSYSLQSKSLCALPTHENLKKDQSYPKYKSNSNSQSSKSLSYLTTLRSCSEITDDQNLFNDTKANLGSENKNQDTGHERLLQSIGLLTQHNNRKSEKFKNKENIPKKHCVHFDDAPHGINQTKYNSFDPPATKEALRTEVTTSELNMFARCPASRKSAVYSWWQRRKLSRKNTQQLLLQTSNTFSFSSSEEDSDIISWRD